MSAQSPAARDAFAALSQGSARKDPRLGHGHRYPTNEHIIPQRGDDHALFFVINGIVKVTYYAARGRQVSFRDTGPGEMFGELAARISTHREAVSREIRALLKAGLVKKVEQRGLQILDVPRLVRMVREVVE